MRLHLIESIENWFHRLDDGDFSAHPTGESSTRIGDGHSAATVVYTTKLHCLTRIVDLAILRQPVAAIGRYGLPVTDDLPFLRGPGQSVSRIFVGDADPPDLLVFAWLREHVSITWHGVNDDFLKRHGSIHRKGIQIPMAVSELETIPNLQRFCPDFRDLLGEYCSSILDRGFKIELEAALIANHNDVHPLPSRGP